MADSNCNTIVVESPNFIPIVSGIAVDIGHRWDAVEVEPAWVRVIRSVPFLPGPIADFTDRGTGARPQEVGYHARVSNVDVGILGRGENFKSGRCRLNGRR
jgi:hypothetical protein